MSIQEDEENVAKEVLGAFIKEVPFSLIVVDTLLLFEIMEVICIDGFKLHLAIYFMMWLFAFSFGTVTKILPGSNLKMFAKTILLMLVLWFFHDLSSVVCGEGLTIFYIFLWAFSSVGMDFMVGFLMQVLKAP